MLMRTANPALNDKTFTNLLVTDRDMTLQGTVNKTGILLFVLVVFSLLTWNQSVPGTYSSWTMVGAGGGLIVAFITAFRKTWAPVTAPIYAAMEGLFVGGFSSFINAMYPGIVMQAVALTFGILGGLLLAYSSKLIKPTENLKLGIVSATVGIGVVYLASMILGFFGINVPVVNSASIFGIGFSVFVVIVAALNLVLDFDFIENGVRAGAPKYMEWYAAFGLTVTLVWLYIEILRLLVKISVRR